MAMGDLSIDGDEYRPRKFVMQTNFFASKKGAGGSSASQVREMFFVTASLLRKFCLLSLALT